MRHRLAGTAERPRLSVFRSLHHFYAQLIDDDAGATLLCASTLDKELRVKVHAGHPSVAICKEVANLLCARAKEKGIQSVVFDHGGFGYRGRIKAFADEARAKGLVF